MQRAGEPFEPSELRTVFEVLLNARFDLIRLNIIGDEFYWQCTVQKVYTKVLQIL